jgi:hypothetical protein
MVPKRPPVLNARSTARSGFRVPSSRNDGVHDSATPPISSVGLATGPCVALVAWTCASAAITAFFSSEAFTRTPTKATKITVPPRMSQRPSLPLRGWSSREGVGS